MGRWHASYARRAGARIVSVVDRDFSLARSLAKRIPGARAISASTWDKENLNRAEVVHLCTPLGSHFDWAKAGLEARCHLLVEKPLARGIDQTVGLLCLARDVKRRLQVVHQLPHQRGFRQIASNLDRLGELLEVEYRAFSTGGDGYPEKDQLRVLLEILPHPISVFDALGLEIEPPGGWKISRAGPRNLELRSQTRGVELEIDLDMRARPPCHELRLVGTRSSAVVDFFHGFGVFDQIPGGRCGKILRPFKIEAARVVAAATNLARRAWAREQAYPGLASLIRGFYRALPRENLEQEGEILAIARIRSKLKSELGVD